MRSSASVFLSVIFLAILSTFADACVLNGPRYQLASDTVHWFLELSGGETCLRGVRFNNVVVDKLMIVSAPRTGHVTLQGTGFSYKAARDFQGRDFFSLMVSGATNKVPGSSTIEVEVSVSNAGESRRFSTMIPPSSQAQPFQPSPAPSTTSSPPSGASAAYRPFTPLHTYYMAASGCNDANSGTNPGSPWCSPNHPVVCGDVIVAAPGTYNVEFSDWGTVSSCPSTSGGIDGTGGIYFAILLCGGSDLNSCLINCATRATGACFAGHVGSGGASAKNSVMNVNKSNWAIEGWTGTGTGASNRGFQVDACLTQTTIIHHIAFVNDIVYNSAQAYGMDDCAYNHSVPGNGGDYFAVIGSIAQNAAQDGICLAAVDMGGFGQSDTNSSAIHGIFYGNFAWDGLSPDCIINFDGEAYMFDTLDAHGNVGIYVEMNNIGWGSTRMGFQLNDQCLNLSGGPRTINVVNNTFWGNYASDVRASTNVIGMEISFQTCTGSTPPTAINAFNNIAQTRWAFAANDSAVGSPLYAMSVGGTWNQSTLNIGGGSNNNIFKGLQTSCAFACDAGNNVSAADGNTFGTNTYADPLFANTTDLLNNRSGTPNCTGFVNVTACMGYAAGTKALTTPSTISDLVPTAGGMTGKGYQLPSIVCNSNSNYPTWLKGIVYLQWHSATSAITQNFDLVTLPCGL
jgi:hypothetical protein